jgi:hypothetical protein
MRGEAPDLPSDVRHLMGIHQGEHHGVQDREHLGYRRKVNPTAILPQRDIAPKVGADFPRSTDHESAAPVPEENTACAGDWSSHRPLRRCACLGFCVPVGVTIFLMLLANPP